MVAVPTTLTLALALALSGAVNLLKTLCSERLPQALVGERASHGAVSDLNPVTVTVASDVVVGVYSGKTSLVNGFLRYCMPCGRAALLVLNHIRDLLEVTVRNSRRREIVADPNTSMDSEYAGTVPEWGSGHLEVAKAEA
ncbi:hypothetical protein PG993_011077 [Apiospora rasikravindrae]|uniref:Uncharacterized protein n=1 Tax=Apiospora rasikravindrae TaxID=990691 RepID=A0ABR1SD52_9PEZI